MTPDVEMSRPHPARVYDVWIGGKDNYEVDRELAAAIVAQLPGLPFMARVNRACLMHAVRRLVEEHGITQFLDVGSGIPNATSVHEVAQDLNSAARVVYVDNDLVVAAHTRALRQGERGRGPVTFLLADATDPGAIVSSVEVTSTLDLQQPVAVLLVSMLMYFSDDVAHRIVSTLMDAAPSGSYVMLTHPTAEFDPDAVAAAVKVAQDAGLTYIPRNRKQVAALLDGLDLVDPGLVPMLDWIPMQLVDAEVPEDDVPGTNRRAVYYWIALARKP